MLARFRMGNTTTLQTTSNKHERGCASSSNEPRQTSCGPVMLDADHGASPRYGTAVSLPVIRTPILQGTALCSVCTTNDRQHGFATHLTHVTAGYRPRANRRNNGISSPSGHASSPYRRHSNTCSPTSSSELHTGGRNFNYESHRGERDRRSQRS